MQKLTVFILFSAIALTIVLTALIPQMIIPEDDDGSIFIKKTKTADIKTVLPENATTSNSPTGGNCDLAVYDMDCKITEYLENNLVTPAKGGKVFCAYEKIGASDTGDTTYLNYACQEFYLANGKIYEGSGAAGPAKIVIGGNGSLSHWVPRDGSYFTRDINESFPPEYHDKALHPNSEKLWQISRARAKTYFSADFDYTVEKMTDTACVHDFDCATPGEYLMMSRCPFTSMCINGKCVVICPNL